MLYIIRDIQRFVNVLDLIHGNVQEAKNYSPSVRPERRRQLQEEMVGSAPMALQVLASCLSRPGLMSPPFGRVVLTNALLSQLCKTQEARKHLKMRTKD